MKELGVVIVCIDSVCVLMGVVYTRTLLVGVEGEGVEVLDVSVTVVATAGLCRSLLTDYEQSRDGRDRVRIGCIDINRV